MLGVCLEEAIRVRVWGQCNRFLLMDGWQFMGVCIRKSVADELNGKVELDVWVARAET